MFSPRIALAGALSGAAALAFTVALAMPASASPTSSECLTAQQTLNADQIKLQSAENTLASAVTAGASVQTLNADRAAVSQAQATVSVDQTAVNIQCGTTTTVPGGTGHHPHPTPAPGPVGLPRDLNCTQLAARGIHDIPSGSVWYRSALDANGDGIGCETNLNTYRVVNGKKCHLIDGAWVPIPVAEPAPCGSCSATVVAPPPAVIYQAPQTVVAPAPVFTAPAPVYAAPIAPSGPAATGR